MYVVCVEFEIVPSQLENFIGAMRKNQDQKNPNSIFLYEIYDDEAAFEAHKAAPHYHEFNHAIDGMVIKKSVRFLQNISHHA